MKKTIIFLEAGNDPLATHYPKKFHEVFFATDVQARQILSIRRIMEQEGKEAEVVALTKHAVHLLTDAMIPFVSYHEFTQKVQNTLPFALAFIRKAPTQHEGFLRSHTLDGVSLWRMCEFELAKLFLSPIIHDIVALKQCLSKERARDVVLFSQGTYYSLLIESLCQATGLRIEYQSKTTETIEHKSLYEHGAWFSSIMSGKVASRMLPPSKGVIVVSQDINAAYESYRPWLGLLSTTPKSIIATTGERAYDAAKDGISYATFTDIAGVAFTEKLKVLRVWLSDELRLLEEDHSFTSLWSVAEVDFYSVFKYIIRLFYLRFALEAKCSLDIFSSLLSKTKPAIVIYGDQMDRIGESLATICESQSIPLFYVQHSLDIGQNITDHLSAENILVFGSVFENTLKSQGISAKQISICGDPSQDQVIGKKTNRELLYEELGLAPSTPLMSYIPSKPIQNFADTEGLFSDLAVALSSQDSSAIVVRPHNVSEVSKFEAIGEKLFRLHGKKLTIARYASTIDLAKISSFVLTDDGPMMMDAVVIGKPVIVVDHDSHDFLGVGASGAVLRVHTQQQMIAAVKTALEPLSQAGKNLARSREAFVESFFFKSDGNSAKRVYQKLMKSIE